MDLTKEHQLRGYDAISIKLRHVIELFDGPLTIDIYLTIAYHIEHWLFPLGVPPLIPIVFDHNTTISIPEELLWSNLILQTDP